MMECIPGRLKGEGWKGIHGESYTRVYIAGVQERVPTECLESRSTRVSTERECLQSVYIAGVKERVSILFYSYTYIAHFP